MQPIKITSIEKVTHDVVHIKTEKPQGISFFSGADGRCVTNETKLGERIKSFHFYFFTNR